jgi:hypothetical protein
MQPPDFYVVNHRDILGGFLQRSSDGAREL